MFFRHVYFVENTHLAAGQASLLTMDNALWPHLLCVFMRATSCHIFIVCSILFCRKVHARPRPLFESTKQRPGFMTGHD